MAALFVSKKKQTQKLEPTLIFTFATEKECPKAFFKTHNIPTITLSGLKSGILNSLPLTTRYLAVITGVGPKTSLETAKLLTQAFTPESIINIGSCGVKDNHHLHKWLQAKTLKDTDATYPVSPAEPVPLPERIHIQTLFTTHKPNVAPDDCQAIDMEASAQASVFNEQGIPFFTLKWATDVIGQSTEKNYCASMPQYLKAVIDLFQWIVPTIKTISVVIPTFNRRESLERALTSVFNQSVHPHEIIIVDDASTDETATYLQAIDASPVPIKVLSHTENGGVSAARNTGIAAAKGDWIALLDSDDEWVPNKLENQLNYLTTYPHYAWVQSQEKWIRNGAHFNQKKVFQKKAGWFFEDCLHRCLVSPSSVIFKKTLFDQYGPFDTQLPACEDYALWLKLTSRFPIGLDPSEALIKYGGHADQLSATPLMDLYRLQGLADALDSEPQIKHQLMLQKKLKEKASILVQGRLKRR